MGLIVNRGPEFSRVQGWVLRRHHPLGDANERAEPRVLLRGLQTYGRGVATASLREPRGAAA